jgi:hypothetical protein
VVRSGRSDGRSDSAADDPAADGLAGELAHRSSREHRVTHRLDGSASKPVLFGRSDEGGGAGSIGWGHQMG